MTSSPRLARELDHLWSRRQGAALSRHARRQTLRELDMRLALGLRQWPRPDEDSPWLNLLQRLGKEPKSTDLLRTYEQDPELTLDWLAWLPLRQSFPGLKALWHGDQTRGQALVLAVLARKGVHPRNLNLQQRIERGLPPDLQGPLLDFIVRLRQRWAQQWLGEQLQDDNPQAAFAWLALAGPQGRHNPSYSRAQNILLDQIMEATGDAPFEYLQLLMLSGNERQIIRWINQFSRRNVDAAVVAMGLSGLGHYHQWLLQAQAHLDSEDHYQAALHGLAGDEHDDSITLSGGVGTGERWLGGQRLQQGQVADPEALSQWNRYRWAWQQFWHGKTTHFADPRYPLYQPRDTGV